MNDLRYPIGGFRHPGPVTMGDIELWTRQIEELPGEMRRAVEPLTDAQLARPYRPGGWTLGQVVHHVPDSHMNSYIRFKWALTEDAPLIKTYYEARWAELDDYRIVPIEKSLDLLDALHARWVALLRALSPGQLTREFRHPDSGLIELGWNVGNYAWHGRHHLAHITTTIERNEW
jgi:hypothetical protein